MRVKNLLKLLFFIFICEAAGIIGSFFTLSAIPTWYQTLTKPVFSPPSWIFGPVWTLLYLLMGVSVYLIWIHNKEVKDALFLFWIQLFFNATWSIMFFGLRSPLLGLINIVILWILIVIVTYTFWKINKWSGVLLLPYFIWVSFAAVLNYNILILN